MQQLRSTTHSAAYPAWAPSVVVAISSPEPTIDAASTMPGPMRRSAAKILTGGLSIADASSAYGLRVFAESAAEGGAVLTA